MRKLHVLALFESSGTIWEPAVGIVAWEDRGGWWVRKQGTPEKWNKESVSQGPPISGAAGGQVQLDNLELHYWWVLLVIAWHPRQNLNRQLRMEPLSFWPSVLALLLLMSDFQLCNLPLSEKKPSLLHIRSPSMLSYLREAWNTLFLINCTQQSKQRGRPFLTQV